MLRNNIVQIYKKYNKSRLNSQGYHLITLLTIPQITIDKIFRDDGNVLCPPTNCFNLIIDNNEVTITTTNSVTMNC